MTRRTDSSRSRQVAAGSSRSHASKIFGEHHDDLFLTTYDELVAEVDLTGAATVDVAADPAAADLLETLVRARAGNDRLRLRVEFAPGDPAGVRALLDRHRDVGVDEVERVGTAVVVGLGPMVPTEAARSLLALDALDLLPPPEALDPARLPDAPASEQPAPAAAPVPVALRPAPRAKGRPPARPPTPVVLRLLDRALRAAGGGSRRRAAALLAVGPFVLVVAVLATVGLGPWGSTGVLVVLGLGTLLGLAVLTVLVLLLQQDLHRQRLSLESLTRRHGRQLRRRTDTLMAQQRGIRRAQADLPFMRQYVEALDAAGSAMRAQLTDWFTEDERRHRDLHLETQRQTQAHLNLARLTPLEGRLPPLGGWAASADLMVLVVEELLRVRPRLVVECGSGASTVLLAMVVREHGLATRVVALEHDERFRSATQAMLDHHDLADVVELRAAPLATTSLADHPTRWYAEHTLEGLDDIGLLLVDGPPAWTGEDARFPAVPLLRDRLTPTAVVVADDTVRDQDRRVAERWQLLLPDFIAEHQTDLQKGAVVFRRDG